VEKLLYQVAAEHQEVLPDPKPLVVFEDFGDNALVFDLYAWCQAKGERDLRMIRSDIRFRIDELCNEHGIVIAFPQRDVHLYAKTPIEIRTAPTAGAESGPGEHTS
jgi:small-conductance mechanosensitive channel